MDVTLTGAPARTTLPRALAWALGSGTVLQGLNSAVIAVALVPIADHYGTSAAIPWLISGLYIASAVGSPTGGRLADLFGARRIYLAGLVLVVLASVLGPFAPSAGWLVADRVLLGLGTSVQFPAAMAIIRREADRRAAEVSGAIGVVALCGQSTAALAPTVGGLIVVVSGWPGIFWINLPLVANCLFWVWRCVPADPPREKRGARAALRVMDVPGALLFVATLSLTMTVLLSLENGTQGRDLALGAAAGLLAALLVLRERRCATPFLDLRLLAAHPAILMTCVRGTVTFVAFYTVFYGMPQWLEVGRGLGPAAAGLLMLPVFGVGVVSTLVATRWAARLGPGRLLLVGNAAFVVSGLVLALTAGVESPLALLVLVNVLLGIPTGFNNLGNQLTLHHASPARASGSASGLYRTAQYIGAAISAVLLTHLVPTDRAAGAAALDTAVRDIGLCLVIIGFLLLATGLTTHRRHHLSGQASSIGRNTKNGNRS
ncbi:MFS transporter [Kineosporia sp. NBRC 101731]|uniref:MFS transporter n=1 Tax=Kineosporia sp. NBRC 101731 TaxID=3032199 RepID=UPI0024A45761|nr:MFS transporter [Kineosporia sp. NBRC 101731]GLY29654.1 MFS transporter [Kineosporia sp. NBRC 101731]